MTDSNVVFGKVHVGFAAEDWCALPVEGNICIKVYKVGADQQDWLKNHGIYRNNHWMKPAELENKTVYPAFLCESARALQHKFALNEGEPQADFARIVKVYPPVRVNNRHHYYHDWHHTDADDYVLDSEISHYDQIRFKFDIEVEGQVGTFESHSSFDSLVSVYGTGPIGFPVEVNWDSANTYICSVDIMGLKVKYKVAVGKTAYWRKDNNPNIPANFSLLHRMGMPYRKLMSVYLADNGGDEWWTKRELASVKSIESKAPLKGNLDRLAQEEPELARLLGYLHSKASFEGLTNNQLLATFYTEMGGDYDRLKSELELLWDRIGSVSTIRALILTLPGTRAKSEDKRAAKQWQFAQQAGDKAEVLGITADRFTVLRGLVEEGKIPFALFHEAGNENKLINVEFELIEWALNQPGWQEPLISIFNNAAGRGTYSRRVTSYLAFLRHLPSYLDRNAPRNSKGSWAGAMGKRKKKVVSWKVMPKFVNSQWELEMNDEATEEGTTKRRSALTPVADNETGVVTVPYAALSLSGVRTSWCYAEKYFVAEANKEDAVHGGVYENDLEVKLNGRDDYGLCYYTLTGTVTTRGYPTFLIIFERTTQHGTRVHFHRVHPSRMRGPNGTDTPPNRLIQECYRYMAGNIRAEEIKHQQGDLLLLPCKEPGKSEEPVPVKAFENHSFVSKSDASVQFRKAAGKARGNLLGYLHSDAGMSMPHPEHESIEEIEPGWFELRRCKSYENNPTGVWVLNID